jgi:hypothetical protein
VCAVVVLGWLKVPRHEAGCGGRCVEGGCDGHPRLIEGHVARFHDSVVGHEDPVALAVLRVADHDALLGEWGELARAPLLGDVDVGGSAKGPEVGHIGLALEEGLVGCLVVVGGRRDVA